MKTTSSFSNRVRLIFAFIFLFSILLIVKLYFMQIIKGDAFSDKADRQYVNSAGNLFDRGSIFFQDKTGELVSAATLKTGYTIVINPMKIVDQEAVYKQLSSVLNLDSGIFYSKASKKDDSREEIAKRVSESDMKKIEAFNIVGLSIEKERWRYYPGDELGANTIGFVGYNGDKLEGRYGLEKYYEDTLVREGTDLYVNVFAEIFSNINTTFIQDKSREGDIITSIDPEVQNFLEKTVQAANKKWSSNLTGGIVIDPKTGEIYGLATYPTFNLNEFNKEKDVGIFSNPLISDAYEMGSIVKPLTMAAGLDAGVVTAKTTYKDEGTIKIDGKTISNYDFKARGVVDMQEVLNQSLNLGASFVADKLGKDRFLNYFQGYGIGGETGIDLPNEAAGMINNLTNNLKNQKKVEYFNASFGQGISMTPIMTVRALSVLANGGKLIIPHVVNKIDFKVGLSKYISYTDEAKQVIKKDTSEEITRMLVKVVDTALAGGTMKMTNYSIAAKTGTAQMARSVADGGGYYTDRYLHSFFGYFPAYNPRFLVFLYTVYPKNVNYASQTLTNPFFDIAKFLINYYEILPDR